MPIVGYGSVQRTYIQAVNRILTRVGKSEAATVAGASRHVGLAMTAVEDARNRVFYRKNWDFRRAFYQLDLVEKTMWYELPADFQKTGSPITLNRLTSPITYLDYEDMQSVYPDLRAFPPGSGVGDINSVTQLLDQDHNFGESKHCTRWTDYIGLMPIPDAAFVALETSLYSTYWRQAAPLTGDEDSLDLPQELWDCHNLIASAYLKKSLEYSDWDSDFADGMVELKRMSNEDREPQDEQVLHDTGINYNE